MKFLKPVLIAGASLAAIPFFSGSLSAHCDSFDGPIIPQAQEALQTGDIQPLMKWVEPEHEAEIAEAFERARNVANQSPHAQNLAELWFIETFVRLHREGEGAPYTGLKPAGSMPAVYAKADEALERGSVEELAEHIGTAVAEEIRTRFAKANQLQESADNNTEAGREFVTAYVDYVHLVEAIHGILSGEIDHRHH